MQEIERLGNIYGFTGGSYAGNVYGKNGICPALNCQSGGNRQPLIVDDAYKNRPPRSYKEYAPTLRTNCGGGEGS